ncbi:DUF4132 domain-containing protein [Nocardioides sp. YIM 152588]|uniref:DUF4132 domain-containing protein n=1 Tax=Nocardioides sp. YIM 152588 TaxID=3158259 RepID=UPI0032E429EF
MGLFSRRRTQDEAGAGGDPEVRALVDAVTAQVSHRGWPYADDVRATDAWEKVSAASEEVRVAVAIEAFTRAARKSSDSRAGAAMVILGQQILQKKVALTAEDRVAMLTALVAYAGRIGHGYQRLDASWDHTRSVLRALERGGEVERFPAEADLLGRVRAALVETGTADAKRAVPRVDALLGVTPEDAGAVFTNPDWCARAIEGCLADLPGDVAKAATAALQLATTASLAKPPKRFLDSAADLSQKHGDDLARALTALLRSGALPVTAERGVVDSVTGDAVRGLCWIASAATPTPELAASLGAWVVTGWTKVPNVGARCRKGASGALWALARLGDGGAVELGRARALVKQSQAVKEVDAAIDAAATELGIPREEFEERVVPSYGLEVGAVRTVPLGDYVATVGVERGKAAVSVAGADGKVRKSVPAVVRRDHAAELADLRALAKDVSTMLSAQRLRLERLLMDERSWEPEVWRERYLDHSLVSVMARPLIWQVVGEDGRRPFVAPDGDCEDVEGSPVSWGAGDRIELWHPALVPTAEVEAWRVRIEEIGVVQPFKQAHREVYLLTDAERRTDVYSNRFAGHILRQHQFAALARARGWKYALQGAWDQPDEMATLSLEQRGLQVGYWVDRPWDADDDWNESGVFNHVLTDQVRFTTTAGANVHLADVPARVLTEVLRDVDLFVGVASIGNDPNWQDSGDARRQTWGEYWSSYSFGELNVAAEVRRDLLARLLPKLAISDVASLDEKFLVVRGSLRTYKIHLGSGNILMEPNDQYLCIVPGRGDDGPSGVMLPFEGDRMLSIVLSKAMLLANDRAITDQTITSQITRR